MSSPFVHSFAGIFLFRWTPHSATPFRTLFAGFLPCTRRFLQGFPPCTRRPLLKKGSIRKLFCGRATYFLWKGKESGTPEPLISGNRSMDSVRRPLCGCFVLSCMVGGIFRKPLGFRRCLPPARPEKAKPFQAGQCPCTKHQQTVRLCLYAPKKVFEGSKGRFFKNAPWQGVGQRPTESRQQEKGRFTVQTPERTSLFRRFLPDSATRRPPWRQAHPVFGFR